MAFPDIDPEEGSWTQVVPKCPCTCPLPLLRFGFSTRIRVFDPDTGQPTEFTPWSEYTYSEYGGPWIGAFFTAENSDPSNGGSETQVRAQVEVQGNGVAALVRYRQIFGAESESTPPETVFSFGGLQSIDIADGFEGTASVDFVFVPCAVGQFSFMAGGPGGASLDAGMGLQRQAVYLRKKGFRQYQNDSGAIVIYRKEQVTDGGSPGCPLNVPPLPPREYSGNQEFQPIEPTIDNQYTLDPAGLYTNSLSADLQEDKHATTPYLLPNNSTNFGKVTYPTDNRKLMVAPFRCGTASEEKTLALELVEEYPTEELVDAVDSSLHAQLTNDVFPTLPDQRIVHRQWLCPEGVHYERVRTTQYSGSIGGFDTVLGGRGQVVILSSISYVAKRSLLTGNISESTITTNFGLQANDDYLVANGRVATGLPDPIPPLPSPWEDPINDNTEILITKVTCKPNQLLCILVPVSEDPAIGALGFD